MSIKRALGLIFLCTGTCAFALVLLIMEVFRTLYHAEIYTLYTLTYFPVALCFAITIGWIIAGIVLIICGKNSREDKSKGTVLPSV